MAAKKIVYDATAHVPPDPKGPAVVSVSFRESISLFGIQASGWNSATASHVSCKWEPGLPYVTFECSESDDSVLVSYASIKSVTVRK